MQHLFGAVVCPCAHCLAQFCSQFVESVLYFEPLIGHTCIHSGVHGRVSNPQACVHTQILKFET